MTIRRDGLMVFWAEIDPDYMPRFREWHNCEHMPERVSIPGFVAGRRYVAVGDSVGVLMMYEADSAGVFASDAYITRLNDPTPWTRESLAHFRNPSRNIYRLVESDGVTDFFAAPYMISVRYNSDTAADIRQIKGIAGVGRVRAYEIDDGATGIQTSEKKIYAAAGMTRAPQRLLLIEAAMGELPAVTQAATAWQDVRIDGFAIDYTLDKTQR